MGKLGVTVTEGGKKTPSWDALLCITFQRFVRPWRGGGSSKELYKNAWSGDFPDGPVVKTPLLECKGQGFNPWSGNEDPCMLRGVAKLKKKKQKQNWNGAFLLNEVIEN